MTMSEALREADRLKPNSFPAEQKRRWLERLELRCRGEILRHYGAPLPQWEPFGAGEMDRTLLASDPYDEMYVHWLCAQMDFFEREYESFNASNAMFEAVWRRWRNAVNQTEKARTARKSYG